MSLLTSTDITATVTWLGLVPGGESGIVAEPVERLTLDWGGPVGDAHHGTTRPSCVRVKRQYARGTEIRNVRQLSILSEEEMADIASDLGLARLAPEWLGATMVVRGVPELTKLPPASRLISEAGLALTTDTENGPCRHPADVIERHHPGQGRAFPKVAMGKRGITAWVERPGTLALGDALRLHLPPQRLWAHAGIPAAAAE